MTHSQSLGGQRSAADILALGFGMTVAMWTAGYVCRFPPALVPSSVLLALMLACLLVGGFVGGRRSGRGWRAGLYAGLLAAALNLLILGSLLTSDQPNRVVPSALWWVPGSFLVAAAAGSIGALAGSAGRSAADLRPNPVNWTNALLKVLACATFLLLIVGGVVTGKEAGLAVVDWPNSFGCNMFLYPLGRMTGGIYYEHAHRLIGSLVGLTMLVAAVHLQWRDPRPAVRRFTWVALGAVVVQGILGGLRVTGRFTLSTSPEDVAPSLTLAMVHGTLGQVFFGMVIALVVLTSTAWEQTRGVICRPSAATDRFFSVALVVLVILQLVFGTILRQVAGGLHIHITMAVVVALTAVNVGVRAWGLAGNPLLLQRLGRTLLGLISGQVLLGIAAYIAVGATAQVQPRPAIDVAITTAHQGLGAILLACTVALVLWTRRLLVPSAATAAAAVTAPVRT